MLYKRQGSYLNVDADAEMPMPSFPNSHLGSLNSSVDKLDIDKLKNVPTNLSNLRSKVDKLDVDKLAPVPVDLSKLSVVVKK